MAVESYTGQCQCGAVRIEARLDLADAITCNCSRCGRMGFVLAFTPEAGATVEGEEATTEFRFNKHVISHRFCATCGVQVYGRGAMPDGAPVVAVNLNCLDGVDARALPAHHYDGASA